MQALPLIIQGVEAAISAAPAIESVVTAAKDWITSLASNGVITIAEQNRVHAHVDAYAAAVRSGIVPPEFTVEPDPA